MKLFSDYFKLLAVAAVFCAASCKQVEAPLIPVQSVTIGQADQTLTVGETVILSATVLPEDADDRSVLWTSSDDAVVMVSSDAHARAIGAGTAQLTASAGGLSASITITVNAAPISPEPEPEVTPVDAVVDSAITVNADHISAVSAVLSGRAILAYATPEVSAGFQYATSPAELPFSATTVEAIIADADYNFMLGVSGLEPGKTYCYRSVIRVEGREHYGETLTFTTKGAGTLITTANTQASDIGRKSVVLRGTVDLTDVQYESVSYGFIWGTAEGVLNNTISATVVSANTFEATLTGLPYDTKIYYKAFVSINAETINKKVVVKGEEKTATTLPNPIVGIDLGLSVRWASCNLGAEEPEEWGDYYAWGEVETYYSSLDPLIWKPGRETGHERSSYKWAVLVDDDYRYTKYCLNNTWSSYWGGTGAPDNKSTLDLEDDPAHVILGGDWRMPTKDEFTELLNNCTLSWHQDGSNRGYVVTGPNGNSIFLPTAGRIRWTSYQWDAGEFGGTGYYWSSSLYEMAFEAWLLELYNTNYENIEIDYDYRNFGFSIRAVIE